MKYLQFQVAFHHLFGAQNPLKKIPYYFPGALN